MATTLMGNQNNKGKVPLNTEIKISVVHEVLPAEVCRAVRGRGRVTWNHRGSWLPLPPPCSDYLPPSRPAPWFLQISEKSSCDARFLAVY